MKADASPEPVAIRALDGGEVWLRPGQTDAEVALATFAGRFHLPPAGIAPRLIWDLGANIGLTMRHMAALYPRARLVGVELDAGNIELAERNVGPVVDRCTLVRAAVWTEAGEVSYDSGEVAAGYRVDAAGDLTVPAITMNDLLQRTGPPDYVKMDIEGGELMVLRGPSEWAEAVATISVECHPPYTLEECRADLERLGFAVTVNPQSFRRRGRDSATGVRARV